MNVEMDEVVALHLAAVEGGDGDDGPVPVERTVAGISDVLGFGDRGMAGRVSLLSTLADLRQEGIVEEREARVANLNGERVAYALTEEGRRRAASIRDRVADREVTVRTADGRSEAVPLSSVDRYLDDPALPRALARTTDDGVLYVETAGTRFVDRREELAALETALADARADGGVAVLVSGEAGVGKTTLATGEFADRATDEGFRVAVGSCRADAPRPYAPFRDVFGEVGLDVVQPERVGSDFDDADRFDAERTSLFASVADRLADAAADEPLAVVVEDLHLAGAPTVALFAHLAENLRAPVVLVGTYRPEDLPGDHPVRELLTDWPDDVEAGRRRHLHLAPFGVEDTRRLIEWVADRPSVSAEFAELIHERTGGNPLFVEETVGRAIEEGVVDPGNDHLPADPDALPLTDGVTEAVDLRLESLDDATERVLEVAALIGQTVPRDVVAAAVDLPETDVRTHVDLLVEARIFERVDDGRLRFVSGLVRETCVERVPERRRRNLHERIAAAYEAVRGDDPDRHAAIAHHRREAGDAEAALEAYREAGDRALDVFAAESARDAYESALAIARDDPDVADDDETLLEVLESLADAESLLDEYDDADRRLQYVAEHTDDADRRRDVARKRARLWRERGDYDRALRIVTDAREAVGLADTRASATLAGIEGFVRGKRGEFDDAEAAYDRAAGILDRLDDADLPDDETTDDLRRSFAHDRAGLDLERGTVDEGTIETYEAEVERTRENDDERNLAVTLLNLGLARGEVGDLTGAIEALRESVDRFESIGIENMVCDARNTLGSMLWYAGRADDAIEQFETARETAEAVGNDRIVAYTNGNVGEVRFARGDLDRAAERTDRALETASSLGNPHFTTLFAAMRARQEIARDRPDAAAEFAADARETAREAGLDDEARTALARLGDVARLRGNVAGALDRYERGLADLDDGADREPTDGSTALYRGLARARVAAGDHDAAADAAERALDIAEGTVHDDDRIGALVALGAARREAGDLERAADRLDRAREIADGTEWTLLGWRADYERGLLARAGSDVATARERLERVRDRAAEGGAERLARRCREALERLP